MIDNDQAQYSKKWKITYFLKMLYFHNCIKKLTSSIIKKAGCSNLVHYHLYLNCQLRATLLNSSLFDEVKSTTRTGFSSKSTLIGSFFSLLLKIIFKSQVGFLSTATEKSHSSKSYGKNLVFQHLFSSTHCKTFQFPGVFLQKGKIASIQQKSLFPRYRK